MECFYFLLPELQNGSSSTIEKENSYFIKNMKASGFGSVIAEFKD